MTTAGGRGVRAIFADKGPGIPDVDQALTDGYTSGGGLGLGLSGARRLVDEFELDTTVGEGTRVTVTKWAPVTPSTGQDDVGWVRRRSRSRARGRVRRGRRCDCADERAASTSRRAGAGRPSWPRPRSATNLVNATPIDGAVVAAGSSATATRPALEFVAFDRGPGIADPAAPCGDGHSTAGHAGRRASGPSGAWPRDCDVHSVVGRGTVLAATLWPAGSAPPATARPAASPGPSPARRRAATPGPCGPTTGACRCHALADGLGHGPLAAAGRQQSGGQLSPTARRDRPARAAGADPRRARRHPGRGRCRRRRRPGRAAWCASPGSATSPAGSSTTGDNGGGSCPSPASLGHQVRTFARVRLRAAPARVVVLHSDGLTESGTSPTTRVCAPRPGRGRRRRCCATPAVRHDDASVVVARAPEPAADGTAARSSTSTPRHDVFALRQFGRDVGGRRSGSTTADQIRVATALSRARPGAARWRRGPGRLRPRRADAEPVVDRVTVTTRQPWSAAPLPISGFAAAAARWPTTVSATTDAGATVVRCGEAPAQDGGARAEDAWPRSAASGRRPRSVHAARGAAGPEPGALDALDALNGPAGELARAQRRAGGDQPGRAGHVRPALRGAGGDQPRRGRPLRRARPEERSSCAEASEAKTRFLANVSHELRTPVNSILGLVRLLDPPDEPIATRSA